MEISLATTADRNEIFKLRYEVYAQELRQHPANTAALLQDPLDEFNVYLIAKINEEIAGFISVTPPDRNIYSIDKYFTRKEIPLKVDEDTYEMRILTVLPSYRGKPIAVALMWAAFRWIQALGGKRILAIGRAEVLDMYLKLGFTSTGNNVDSGEVI